MQEHDTGLDQHGFIRSVYSIARIQPEFKSVVDSVVHELNHRLPTQIDGIYLYGSVPRGEAIAGDSDLDVSIVLNEPITESELQVFKQLSATIPRAYPEVAKLDIDPGYLVHILKPTERYHWQFWLKHCCCCVWGNDRATSFRQCTPSREIALALNGDLPVFLEQMSGSFARMNDATVAKVLGKKLLRAAYYFIADQDGSWYTDLTQCAQVAKKYYPNQHDDIELAHQFALGILTSKLEALALYKRMSKAISPN